MTGYSNSFNTYVEEKYGEVGIRDTKHFWFKVVQVTPRLLRDVLMDAGIEVALLVVLGCVLYLMSQGKDIIVGLFEPNGLYNVLRLCVTTLAIGGYAICMWLMPAFIFELKDRKTRKRAQKRQPEQQQDQQGRDRNAVATEESRFKRHLFFAHRLLPFLPFWTFALFIHHISFTKGIIAGLIIGEVLLIYLMNTRGWPRQGKKRIILALGALVLILVAYIVIRFQQDYYGIKFAWSVLLITLSILFFLAFKFFDARILAQTASPRKNVFCKYPENTAIWVIMLVTQTTIMVLCVFVFNLKVLAPESLLLFVLSFYVFFIDLLHYIVTFSQGIKAFVNILVLGFIVLTLHSWRTHRSTRYDLPYLTRDTAFVDRDLPDFEEYYDVWKRRIIDRPDPSKPYPIVLVSGEGGGSRAGLWFAQSLMDFDVLTKGKFKDHIFSMSTVSGSSVGLGAMLSYWSFIKENHIPFDAKWEKYPGRVFHYNFVGGSVLGLATTDLWKSLYPFHDWKTNRNLELQQEEAICIQRSLVETDRDIDFPKINLLDRYDSIPMHGQKMYMSRDYLDYYLYRDKEGKIRFKADLPLSFINTCRSEDSRRAIFSPVRINSNEFLDAIDLSRYIYSDGFQADKPIYGLKRAVSLGVVCNTSELFPIFSEPAYIDSMGYFVDGGYHENSGLKTTLDVYRQLVNRLKCDSAIIRSGDYKIYIVYLKNSQYLKKYYPGEMGRESAGMQPLIALTNAPFGGSASYFEEQARRELGRSFIRFQLDYKNLLSSNEQVSDSPAIPGTIQAEMLNDITERNEKDSVLNFPLARWLSHYINRRMVARCEWECVANDSLKTVIREVNE